MRRPGNRMLTTLQEERATHFLRKLEPAIVSPYHISGGKPEITAADIAAALTGAKPIALWIARAKYLADPVAEGHIRGWMLAAAITVAHRDGWKQVSFPRKVKLASIAANDVIPTRCPTCKSRKLVPSREANLTGEPCPQCAGSGIILLGPQDKADILGVKLKTWRNTWQARLFAIIHHYRENEWDALTRVNLHLGY